MARSALLVLDDDVRLDRGVGHRQQGDPALGQTPARRQPGGDLRERLPLPEPQRPRDVGAEVAVSEAEPLRLDAVRGELLLQAVALVGPAPPLALVDPATERVEHGVEVGGDPQPEEGDVVAGVADDGDLRARELRGAVEVAEQTPQETGSADASGQGGDAHGASLSVGPASGPGGRPEGGGAGLEVALRRLREGGRRYQTVDVVGKYQTCA